MKLVQAKSLHFRVVIGRYLHNCTKSRLLLSSCSEGRQRRAQTQYHRVTSSSKGMQKKLTRFQAKAQSARVQQQLEASGYAGQVCLAQLRSQKADHSMAWLSPSATPSLSSVETAGLILMYLFIDPWRINNTACPYGCSSSGPASVHAIGCPKQHTWGSNAHAHPTEEDSAADLLQQPCWQCRQ
jgi:hypothetical protein